VSKTSRNAENGHCRALTETIFKTSMFRKLALSIACISTIAFAFNAAAVDTARKSSKPSTVTKVEVTTFTAPFKYLDHSPETGIGKTEEGIAWDGTNHYLIFRASIFKVDKSWTNVIAKNESPFTGLTGFDHLGAGEYYNGKLYVATESYHGCAHVTNQSIFVFDANTLDRKSVTSVSNFTSEVSAVTIVTNQGPSGIVFVSNFCDDSKLYKFNLSDLSFAGTLALDMPISKLQGIAYRNGLIYAVNDVGPDGEIYDIDAKTGHTRKRAYVKYPHGKEVEGCLFNGKTFEIMVASHTNKWNYVYNFSVE
jgi:outer membrane protein assembly factor BamB